MDLNKESLKYDYTMVDATNILADDVVKLIVVSYEMNFKYGDTKYDYYCGITNNLDGRMDDHCRDDFSIVDNKVFAWNCQSAEIAAEVEKRLGIIGFDIGKTETFGNGGVETSTKVYMLKKGETVNR